MKHIRSVIPANDKASVFVEKNVRFNWEECLKIYKKDGRAGEVQMIIMSTNKYLNKGLLSKLARDYLLHSVKPG